MVDFEVQGKQTFPYELAKVEDLTFVNTMLSQALDESNVVLGKLGYETYIFCGIYVCPGTDVSRFLPGDDSANPSFVLMRDIILRCGEEVEGATTPISQPETPAESLRLGHCPLRRLLGIGFKLRNKNKSYLLRIPRCRHTSGSLCPYIMGDAR